MVGKVVGENKVRRVFVHVSRKNTTTDETVGIISKLEIRWRI